MATRKDDRFYVRVAIDFFDHPKVLAAGRDAWCLYLVALAWSRQLLTDGRVDGRSLPLLAFKAGLTIDQAGKAADALVEVRLWERGADCWEIHDYAAHQLTADDIERVREGNRERQARYRQSRSTGNTSESSRPDNALLTRPESESESESETEKSVSLSREVPTRAKTPETTDDEDAALDERALAALASVAEHVARDKGARNPRSYARTVCADPDRRTQIATLAAANPDRDAAWLAREHLGQPHPTEPCGNCKSIAHRTAACPIPPMERR